MSHSERIKAARRLRAPETSPIPYEYPIAPSRIVSRLAAVCCHYNPCGYARIEDNYYRFAEGLAQQGLELYTIELAYDEAPHRLPDGETMIRVRGLSGRHILWQKERLLNLAIEQLPEEVDAIAWLDADLLWFNRDWVGEAASLLENFAVVQLFERVHDLDSQGRIVRTLPGHVHAEKSRAKYGRPGGAWAARREAIPVGLYDRHALGGSDSAMVFAWENREELPLTLDYGSAWERHFREWAEGAYGLVQSSLGCVSGDVVHLYHGTRKNRQYVERYQIFHDHAYDPAGDVDIDPVSGLLQWSAVAIERKPGMVRRVAEYFQSRREDD